MKNICEEGLSWGGKNGSVTASILECHVLAADLTVSVGVVGCVLASIIYQQFLARKRPHLGSMFSLHEYFWIVTLFHILCTFCLCAESVIVTSATLSFGGDLQYAANETLDTDSSSDEAVFVKYLPRISPMVNFVAVLCVTVLYRISESVQTVKFLWIHMIFYLCTCLLSLAKTYLYISLYHLTLLHVSLVFTVLNIITGGVILIILVQVYLLRTRVDFLQVNEVDLKNVKYLHNYSTFLSRISFFWLTPLLRQGYKRPMEEEDLGELPPEDSTSHYFDKFNDIYGTEKDKCKKSDRKLSLWKCMFRTVWKAYVIGGVLKLLADLSGFVAPLGIKTIVEYAGRNSTISTNSTQEAGDSPTQEYLTLEELMTNGYVMAIIVLLANLLQSTFSQVSTFLVNSEGIHVKTALQALIYKKALTLCSTKTHGSGSNSSSSSSSSLSLNVVGDANNKLDGLKNEEAEKSNRRDDSMAVDAMNNGNGSSTAPTFDTGSISNLMSEDTNNIMLFFWNAHFIWAIPLKILVLMVLLYLQLGFSALIGAAICIAVMIPLQYLIIAKYMSPNSREVMERCDERLRVVSEILQGMKLLKLHGWELMFGERANAVRKTELRNLDKDMLYKSLMTFLTHISSVLMTVVTFGLYPYIEEEKLLPSKVFAGLALFNKLTVPLFIFPNVVPVVIEALVSTRRVTEFLSLPEATALQQIDREEGDNFKKMGNGNSKPLEQIQERDEYLVVGSTGNLSDTDSVFKSSLENIREEVEDEVKAGTGDAPASTLTDDNVPVVEIKNGSFVWDHDMQTEQGLRDIQLEIPKGKLTVIVGATGSGKSSLIHALLGEMKCSSGNLLWTTGTTIAYAGQKPWMLNATVRDNIIFGSPFRPKRYQKVVAACALETDIKILPEQDDTEIGSKGINLSGGQKQRIAIARALYSQADVVVLDDPLSALDIDVAHHVLETGIRKFLGKSNRTVILVTHHLPVLRYAHKIVAMEKGKIRIQGTLEEIKKEDSAIHAEWMNIMTKKEAEMQKHQEAKTAKERWSLVKLISKIGLQFRSRGAEANWKAVDDPQAPLEPFRKRKGTFSHYKNLSNDMFSPNDEHHDEIMTPLLRRRAISRPSRGSRTSTSSTKRPELIRMSSLQHEADSKKKSPILVKKLSRLHSLPADDDAPHPQALASPITRDRLGTDSSQKGKDSMLKRILTTRISSVSSATVDTEKGKGHGLGRASLRRLHSSTSGHSEDDEEEDEDETAIFRHESSQEEREYGTIPWEVYRVYAAALGYFLSTVYLIVSVGYEGVRVYSTFWLSRWSNAVAKAGNDQDYAEIMSYHFYIYVVLSVSTVVVSLASNLIGKEAGANSREVLHRKMMDRVLRCPMSFFDSTPTGRIITRFSSDMAFIDRKLCISMQRLFQFVFLCSSAIIVNAIVNFYILVGAVPLIAIYFFIQRFYRFSSRELQRLEAISRGPIYSHFLETLEGLSTIRAYRKQERFTMQMIEKIEVNNRAAAFINVGNRWLSGCLDYLGSIIVFLATVASLISSQVYPQVITPSMVGLAINYILLVPVYLNQVVKFLAEVEMYMNSVERVNRYAELEIEDYGDDSETFAESLAQWPPNGRIEYDHVTIQYDPDRPAIISDLSVTIPAKQKVGICGRSGSGKSTFLMALFRISDVSQGKIMIDGVDIRKLPLLKLRSSLSIIPQENILFTGSFRFNLDPAGKAQDADIWTALENCQMAELVRAVPGQLDGEVKNGGAEYSAGQKQLLGLARAIIHKSKVVIMDEATSSVDFATERTLLQVVKEVFKDSTVLTIAHRLETIVDGNRVLVLDAGKIAEDGVPSTLRKKPLSIFATMLRHADERNNFE